MGVLPFLSPPPAFSVCMWKDGEVPEESKAARLLAEISVHLTFVVDNGFQYFHCYHVLPKN